MVVDGQLWKHPIHVSKARKAADAVVEVGKGLRRIGELETLPVPAGDIHRSSDSQLLQLSIAWSRGEQHGPDFDGVCRQAVLIQAEL